MVTLLLNYVYYTHVGHPVEALRYSKRLVEANRDVELHVALNGRATPDVTRGCPWIAETYAIDLAEFDDPDTAAAAVARLPQRWDYIIEDAYFNDDERAVQRQLRTYCRLTGEMLVATKGRGTTSPSLRLPEGLGYRPQAKVVMSVPPENRAFAQRYAHDGPKVCVLLGGSDNYYRYPDVSSWIRILDAIRSAFPEVRFYLTEVRESVRGQTSTAGYTFDAICKVLGTGPVETAWLALSGGHWPEYFFNDVPFYSVLPDDPEFPHRGKLYPEGSAAKLPSMRPENLDRKIPEVVEGMRLLLSPELTYAAAIERYQDNIARANIKRERMVLPTDPSLASF